MTKIPTNLLKFTIFLKNLSNLAVFKLTLMGGGRIILANQIWLFAKFGAKFGGKFSQIARKFSKFERIFAIN